MPDDFDTLWTSGFSTGTNIIGIERNNGADIYWLEYVSQTKEGKTSFVPAPPSLIIDIDSDRYTQCLKLAHTLKDKFPLEGLDPKNPHDLELIMERESAITEALTRKIHQKYGDYNKAITEHPEKSGTEPTLHNDVHTMATGGTVQLSDFASGELICRQYAPLAKALFTAAGVSNVLVGGHSYAYDVNDKGKISNAGGGGHVYLVSSRSGNVIDPTAKGTSAYQYKANAISFERFLAGVPILTGDASGHYITYGTGFHGGEAQDKLLKEREDLIMKRDFKHLPCEPTNPKDLSNNEAAIRKTESEMILANHYKMLRARKVKEEARAELLQIVKDFDRKNPALSHDESKVKQARMTKLIFAFPSLVGGDEVEGQFRNALRENEFAKAEELIKTYPLLLLDIHTDYLQKRPYFKDALEQRNLPMVAFLLDHGVGQLDGLRNAVHDQDFPLTEILLDHGGLKEALPLENEPLKKLLWTLPRGQEGGLDKEFVTKLVRKLKLTPEDCLSEAGLEGHRELVEIALEAAEKEPKTPSLKDALEHVLSDQKWSSETLNADARKIYGFPKDHPQRLKIQKLITEFMEKHYPASKEIIEPEEKPLMPQMNVEPTEALKAKPVMGPPTQAELLAQELGSLKKELVVPVVKAGGSFIDVSTDAITKFLTVLNPANFVAPKEDAPIVVPATPPNRNPEELKR